jgi:hypothetical protein
MIVTPQEETSMIEDEESKSIVCGDNRGFYGYVLKILRDAVPPEKMILSKRSYEDIKSTYPVWMRHMSMFKTDMQKELEEIRDEELEPEVRVHVMCVPPVPCEDQLTE